MKRKTSFCMTAESEALVLSSCDNINVSHMDLAITGSGIAKEDDCGNVKKVRIFAQLLKV